MRAVDQTTRNTATVDVINGALAVTIVGGAGGTVTWDSIEDKPAVIAAGATQAEARTAIGAGTSSLAIGTTGTTAMAGNKTLANIGGVVPTAGLPAATATAKGAVIQAAAVADATDEASAVTQLNALLAALRTAGIIVT